MHMNVWSIGIANGWAREYHGRLKRKMSRFVQPGRERVNNQHWKKSQYSSEFPDRI